MCFSTSVTCRQLFTYVSAGLVFGGNGPSVTSRGNPGDIYFNFPTSWNVSGYAPLAAMIYWDTYCPLDSLVTIYGGMSSTATCRGVYNIATLTPTSPKLINAALQSSGLLYGTTINTCATSNCNVLAPPSSPPPPPAAAPPTDSLSLILYGYSLATFTSAPQLAFTRAVASVLSVPTSYVIIVSFNNIGAGRRMLSDSLTSTTSSMNVFFTVYSSFTADSLVTQLLTNSSLNAALATQYFALGLYAATVTDVTVTNLTPTSSPASKSNTNTVVAGVVGSIGGLLVAGGAALVFTRSMRKQSPAAFVDAKPDLTQHLLAPEPGPGAAPMHI